MIEKNKKITTLEQRLNENEQLGSRELIRHLNEEYGAGFSDGMVIECLSDLPNEDGDIDGIWFDTFSENGTPSFRYRGPDAYEEVRKADKKAALEIMRQGLPPVY